VEPEVPPVLVEAPPVVRLRLRLRVESPVVVEDVDPVVALVPPVPDPAEDELVDWAKAGAARSRAAAARVAVEGFTTRLLDCDVGRETGCSAILFQLGK
jgi:hypothetical protein